MFQLTFATNPRPPGAATTAVNVRVSVQACLVARRVLCFGTIKTITRFFTPSTTSVAWAPRTPGRAGWHYKKEIHFGWLCTQYVNRYLTLQTREMHAQCVMPDKGHAIKMPIRLLCMHGKGMNFKMQTQKTHTTVYGWIIWLHNKSL